MLSVACCMLCFVCCMLYVECCMLFMNVVCCMLYVVCCMLYGVCCMLYAASLDAHFRCSEQCGTVLQSEPLQSVLKPLKLVFRLDIGDSRYPWNCFGQINFHQYPHTGSPKPTNRMNGHIDFTQTHMLPFVKPSFISLVRTCLGGEPIELFSKGLSLRHSSYRGTSLTRKCTPPWTLP